MAGYDFPEVDRNYEVRLTDDKGMAMFASRNINPGEYILVERCALWRPKVRSKEERFWSLLDNFEALDEETREAYLRLHAWYDPEALGIYREQLSQDYGDGSFLTEKQIQFYAHVSLIFRSNCFEIYQTRPEGAEVAPGKDGVFLEASRFNHSCDPNVSWSLSVISGYFIASANRPIRRGEEMTIAYVSARPGPERRRQELAVSWGFTCRCEICEEGDSAYDRLLEEARYLQDDFGYMEDQGELESHLEDDRDEGFRDRLETRVETLEDLGWDSQLYYAHFDAADYYNYRYAESLRLNAGDAPELRVIGTEHIAQAVAIGKRLWGERDLKTWAAINFQEAMGQFEEIESEEEE